MVKPFSKHLLQLIQNHLLKHIPNHYDHFLLKQQCENNAFLLAKQQIRHLKSLKSIKSLEEVEFRVFSQWGEDGIIQYLINHIPIAKDSFIEFGVDTYVESNTRFLLMNNNWCGLIFDPDKQNIRSIRAEPYYWRYDLTAQCQRVTRENCNDLFTKQGFFGEIGLLSIDIDGNDYWVWNAIECITPRIVICEYNPLFGNSRAISIPYEKQFNRTEAHFSNLYFGASLKALCFLAHKKGYAFVGTNSAGCNAFFVKKEYLSSCKTLTADQGYRDTRVRESFDEQGNRNHLSGTARLDQIGHLPVVDVETGRTYPLGKMV